MRLAKDYDSLDRWGRQALRELAETELQRMEDEKRFQEEAEEPETPPVINLFINPSAAGPALGETGQSCEPYELKPEDPRGASYAIRVQGNSMEPDFPDESIVFVNHDEMRDGDIGVFCVDGATVIKQWHYDRMLGITYLFSLNRKRSDADLVITASSGRSLVWQGRVMTKKEISPSGEIKKPPEGGEEEDHMNHEEKMISMLEEINQRLVSVEVAQENILIPQIQALAEGQKTILDTLAPKSKVEALEEEVELLKSIIKMHTNQINDLKKAQ